jgi:hypothetical protein
MAREYNTQVTLYALLPAFLGMVALYALQHRKKPHVQSGAVYAAIGGVGLFWFDCLKHFNAHHVFVGVVCVGAWHWKRDLRPVQASLSGAGFAVGVSGLLFLQFIPHYVFGAMIGIGEFMILTTWVSMIFN